MHPGEIIIGMVVPVSLILIGYMALLGQERRRLMLIIAYYRAIKENADKERRMARSGQKVRRRLRELEAQAIELMEQENLIRFVEPPPAPPEEPPAPKQSEQETT